MLTLLIDGASAGCTVEELLRREGFSRHQIRSLKFREGALLLEGARCRVTERVYPGQRLCICLDDQRPAAAPEKGEPLLEALPETALLYRDEDLFVADKPAGLAVHRGRGHYLDNLADLLARTSGRANGSKGAAVPVHIVGRLDRDTSGAVLAARHGMAAARLARQRECGRLQKTYLAVVCGRMERTEGTVALPLRPVPGEKNRMETAPQGLPAVTHYRVLGESGETSLVELWLETGRTHQIRVHMAALGHPLLYDPLYGQGAQGYYTALHAWKLAFDQPFTGERICVTAPVARREFKEQGYEL